MPSFLRCTAYTCTRQAMSLPGMARITWSSQHQLVEHFIRDVVERSCCMTHATAITRPW